MPQDIDRVVEIVKRAGEIEDIAPDADFYRAGVDSMKGMDIMLELETEFGITVPDDQFVKARTPQALVELVERLRTA